MTEAGAAARPPESANTRQVRNFKLFADMEVGETDGDWHRVSQVEFEYRPLIESADPNQIGLDL